MTKQKISKYFVILAVTTFLAVFFHIVEISYSKLIEPSKEVSASQLLKPVNPDLDTSIIPTIENRRYSDADNLLFNLAPPTTSSAINP